MMRAGLLLVLLLGWMMPACTRSQAEDAALKERAVFCSVLLAEGVAYVSTHIAERQQALASMDFASDADREAYQQDTERLRAAVTGMDTAHTLLREQFSLDQDTETYSFEGTSREAADARIEFSEDCAPLLRQ